MTQQYQGPITLSVVELATDAIVTLSHNIDTVQITVSSTTQPLRCYVEGERLVVGDLNGNNKRHPLSHHAASFISFLTCASLLSKAPLEKFNSPLEVVIRWYITYTLTFWAMQWLVNKLFSWFASWIQYSYKFTVHLISLEEVHLGSTGSLVIDQSLLAPHVDIRSTGGSLFLHHHIRTQQQSVGLGSPIQTLRLYLSGKSVINGYGAVVPSLQVVTRAGSGHITGLTATQQLTTIALGTQQPPYRVAVATTPECVNSQLRAYMVQ